MKTQVLKYIKDHNPKTADQVFKVFRGKVLRDEVREIFNEYQREQQALKDPIAAESQELIELREIVATIHTLEKGIQIHEIKPSKGEGGAEGTAVMVASDWHIEERVDPELVNGLNFYDLDESKRRSDLFFANGLKLTNMFGRDIKITNIVLALLGDFFSNDIHDELAELCLLAPMDACLRAQRYIASGIQYLLDNSDYTLTIVCCSGNHARTTDKVRFSTEAGHSLEFYMYNNLADHFANNSRVKFVIKGAYHAYLDILGYKVRFHHGHSLRYQGGISGLFVPAYKMIAKWNNAIPAKLDVFGHFHQYVDGTTFIANGSMIGYNAYSLRNGFAYERPQQAYFLIDSKRGRTISAPILFQ